MGRSEELGRGLRNVYKYSKICSGSDNIVFLEEGIFQATIPLTVKDTGKVTIKVTGKVTNKVTENQKKINLSCCQNIQHFDNIAVCCHIMIDHSPVRQKLK